jgi:hypothetical protein
MDNLKTKLDDSSKLQKQDYFEDGDMDIDDEILHEDSPVNMIPKFDSKFEFAMKKGKSAKTFYDYKTVQSPQQYDGVSIVKNGSAFQTQNVNIVKNDSNFQTKNL